MVLWVKLERQLENDPLYLFWTIWTVKKRRIFDRNDRTLSAVNDLLLKLFLFWILIVISC